MSMINSVSGISFRGDVAPANDLISAPSKFSNPAPQAEAPADSFEKAGEKKGKSDRRPRQKAGPP